MNNAKIKKTTLLGLATIFTISVTFVCASAFSAAAEKSFDGTYSLKFNSSKNKLFDTTTATGQSGTTEDDRIKTEHNNNVTLAYTNVSNPLNNTWHIVCASGSFQNTTLITGIESISISFKTGDKAFRIYYSENSTFSDSRYVSGTSSTDTTFATDFDGYKPNYFKFTNEAGSNINIGEIQINISCSNLYPNLEVSSGDTSKGSITTNHSGPTKIGTSVTINATPIAGYKFVEWLKDGVSVSTSASYSFVMGSEDCSYVASFTENSYSFTVSSESTSKGTVSGSPSGTYTYKSEMSVTATPNDGYTFDGWYNGSTKESELATYEFTMPSSNLSLVAKFTPISYDLTLVNDDSDKGSISGELSRTIPCGSSVTLEVTCNTGVQFLGWYENDTLIEGSNKTSWTFTMPYGDHEYHAKFSDIDYTMGITYDNTKGSVTGNGIYHYGDDVTLTATPIDGNSFFGWFNGATLVSNESELNFSMPASNLTYEARFVKNYKLTISSNDETMGTVSGPTECGAGTEVTVHATPIGTNALDYWADENFEEVSYERNYTFIMPEQDISLYAVFTNESVQVQAIYDNTKGSIDGNGYYKSGRTAKLNATPIDDCVFKGWYSDSEYKTLLTYKNSYEITVPSSDISLYAKFLTKEEEEEENWNKNHGIIPVISEDGKTLTYGLYPQTHVNDSALIAELEKVAPATDEEYFLYNNEYYVKDTGNPYDSSYTFSDDTTVVDGETYYFKCEPIKWNIKGTGTNYTIDCSSILYGHRFDDDSNVYANSELRTWLNDDFYNKAFSIKSTASYIQPTDLSDVEVTGDNVWVGSKNQYETWYIIGKTRQKKVSDFALCNYTNMLTSSSYLRNGYYWTRSPDSDYSDLAQNVNRDGGLGISRVSYSGLGVSPALTIKI